MPAFDRFVSRLQLNWETDCWEWIAGKTIAGYGVFPVRHDKSVLAHRVAYDFFVGPLEDGKEIHHKCRNRACCCPNHIEQTGRPEHGVAHRGLKTRCNFGHEFTPENTIKYTTRSGKPRTRCKECNRLQMSARVKAYRATHPSKVNQNFGKTVCKRGHTLSGDNLKITTHGNRQCKECLKMLQSRWRKAHKDPNVVPRGTPKKFCKHNHEMTPENTYTYRNRRSCLICIMNRVDKHRKKKRTLLDTAGPDRIDLTQPMSQ